MVSELFRPSRGELRVTFKGKNSAWWSASRYTKTWMAVAKRGWRHYCFHFAFWMDAKIEKQRKKWHQEKVVSCRQKKPRRRRSSRLNGKRSISARTNKHPVFVQTHFATRRSGLEKWTRHADDVELFTVSGGGRDGRAPEVLKEVDVPCTGCNKNPLSFPWPGGIPEKWKKWKKCDPREKRGEGGGKIEYSI